MRRWVTGEGKEPSRRLGIVRFNTNFDLIAVLSMLPPSSREIFSVLFGYLVLFIIVTFSYIFRRRKRLPSTKTPCLPLSPPKRLGETWTSLTSMEISTWGVFDAIKTSRRQLKSFILKFRSNTPKPKSRELSLKRKLNTKSSLRKEEGEGRK